MVIYFSPVRQSMVYYVCMFWPDFLIYIHNKNSSLHLYYELASERIEEKLAF